jgi:hypothetical protein
LRVESLHNADAKHGDLATASRCRCAVSPHTSRCLHPVLEATARPEPELFRAPGCPDTPQIVPHQLPPARAPLASPRFDSRRPVHGLLHIPCESTCSRVNVTRCDFDGRHHDPAHGHLHCPRESVFAPGYAGEVLHSQSTALQHLARACRDSPTLHSPPSARPGVYTAFDVI